MRLVKIDPHWQPHGFCQLQRGVNKDSRGCLVYTHNNPIPSVQYNSTEDLWGVLVNPELRPFFTQSNTLYIALCFKASPSGCDDNPTNKGWISLVDDFFTKANKIISENKLNIEFVLDGEATPDGRPCLKDRWRPWNSTWINSPESAITSNDNGDDRFQIYNTDTTVASFQKGLDINLGKFRKNKYPYQLWEPSDQSEFELFSQMFLNWTAASGNDKNLMYAINIDPIMFELYNGRKTLRTFHHLLPVNNDNAPYVVTLTVENKPTIAVLFLDTKTSKMHYSFFAFSPFNTFTLITTQALPIPPNLKKFPGTQKVTVSRVDSSSPAILVSDENGNSVIYVVQDYVLQIKKTFTLPQQSADQLQVVQIIHQNNSNSVVSLSLPKSTGSGCALGLDVWDTSSSTPKKVTSTLCATNSTFSHVSGFFFSGTALCEVEGLVMGSSSEEGNSFVWIAQYCLNHSGEQTISKFKKYGVGSDPQVSAIKRDDSWVVMVVQGNGFCYNSHTHNTAHTRLCSQKAISTPRVLTYHVGDYQSWVEYLGDLSATTISSCNSKILHGAYDQGYNPDLDLFVNPQGKYGVIEVHQGVKASDKDVGGCGMPLSYSPNGGTVMDGWWLPQLL
eukprot:TRINITY_DN6200_c0_g1_i1.p1 TRINITY_DN6200_c0_g1~~TRINITY_DN6200_c0_g1_i1.p1  ORF type:complete len:617 (+),score=72.23 TRINITY_DN6200_c0_g1_i1:166-2016(+)